MRPWFTLFRWSLTIGTCPQEDFGTVEGAHLFQNVELVHAVEIDWHVTRAERGWLMLGHNHVFDQGLLTKVFNGAPVHTRPHVAAGLYD